MESSTLGPGPEPRNLLEARSTPESRGLERDEVRLLVSAGSRHEHGSFRELADILWAGDVLVVNRSATLAASLEAKGSPGEFMLNLSTRYGTGLWLAEPRWSAGRPGPLPLATGERIMVAGSAATILAPYPGIPRLRFVAFAEDPFSLMSRHGRPVRYGYLAANTNLADYQTIFGDRPGSAEMPSAARPFTVRVLESLERAGIELVSLTLHTGVSSLESGDLHAGELYPEPFELTAGAAAHLNDATRLGRRIIAVGTTVVRALASAWDGRAFRAARGMTRVYVRPGRQLPPLAGMLTGFHEPEATHLAMLEAIAGREQVAAGYRQAREAGYLWHEFGDVHLLLGRAS
ncbi:MAG: S-adenosylmethionine:tRNA ribosyltransferase-isomerase [Trueperaceae bacterium]